MDKNNIFSLESSGCFEDPSTELLSSRAHQMLAQATEMELDEFLTHYRDQRSATGLQAVVKSGYHPWRQVQTGIGAIAVRMPKVRSNTTEPVTFRSSLVPPYLRRSMQLEKFVPYLYLKGISSGDMADVLRMLVGDAQVRGFSTGVVSRQKQAGKMNTSKGFKPT